MKTHLFLAALAMTALGTASLKADDMPAILKNVKAKHEVTKLDQKKMQDVRGDLVLPLNLGPGNLLTLTLLEPNTVLRVNTVTSRDARPAGSDGINILNLIRLGQSTSDQPASTTYYTIGVIDNGELLNFQSSRTFP